MIKIKVFHECDKPSMIVGQKAVKGPRRLATLFSKTLVTCNSYERHVALWTCPKCKSEWRWFPGYRDDVEGMWLSENRTHRWVEKSIDNYSSDELE